MDILFDYAEQTDILSFQYISQIELNTALSNVQLE